MAGRGRGGVPPTYHDDMTDDPIRCSFCGKEQGQVRKLVKGPNNTFICDECVAACVDILEYYLFMYENGAAKAIELKDL